MKPRSYTSEGIILSKSNLGEADKIITIFSKNFGKISMVAKGVRKPKSRKRGHLEIFSLVKFQCFSGKSLDIITEVETLDDFQLIKTSLKKVSLAYYFCEVISKITNDYEMNLGIFNLLVKSMKILSTENDFKNQRFNFIHSLLVLTGYHPESEKIIDHDTVLNNVIERTINSQRVGKIMLQ